MFKQISYLCTLSEEHLCKITNKAEMSHDYCFLHLICILFRFPQAFLKKFIINTIVYVIRSILGEQM